MNAVSDFDAAYVGPATRLRSAAASTGRGRADAARNGPAADRGHLLAFNAGSSSLKFELFAYESPLRSVVRGAVRDIGRNGTSLVVAGRAADTTDVATLAGAARLVLRSLRDGAFGAETAAADIVATAHRVAQGGPEFDAPVIVTPQVYDRLSALGDLAPLHNPAAVAVMAAVADHAPAVPALAVFDSAFYRCLPEHVTAYAVPRIWQTGFAVRRYGFHGIAHSCLSRRITQWCPANPPERVLTLQLGQGCSITALRGGRPVETSMGFTPLDGLIMGTRPGDLDAGVLLHLARKGWSWKRIEHDLYRESGLRGLSGASDDMRELLRLEAAGHSGAANAIAAFCHRIHKYVGAYAAVLGGVDAIAFGGGIGENAPTIRARICAGLEWLGLKLDAETNRRALGVDARLSAPSSTIGAYCLTVNEEEAIAREAAEFLRRCAAGRAADKSLRVAG
jgi:acetate kinase